MFHPLDPVAYRIEPLLADEYSKVPPEQVTQAIGGPIVLEIADEPRVRSSCSHACLGVYLPSPHLLLARAHFLWTPTRCNCRVCQGLASLGLRWLPHVGYTWLSHMHLNCRTKRGWSGLQRLLLKASIST